MKKIKNIQSIAMVFALAIGLFACKNDKVDLKFNLKKGDKFEYVMNMNMLMKMDMGNGPQDIKSDIKMGYTFEALNDSAGWKTLSAAISKIGMNMNMGMMSINYDSDKNDNDTGGLGAMFGKILGAMKGGSFQFTMNEKGEVGSVTGIKEMMEKALANANIGDAGMMAAGITKSFDENSFKQNLSQSFSIYPGKPVKVGEKWNKNLEIETNGMKMKMDNAYTLTAIKGSEAVIKVDSKISTGKGMEAMKIGMNGTMTGDVNYQIETGMPVSGTSDFKLKMTMEGQEKPMDMEMKMIVAGKKL